MTRILVVDDDPAVSRALCRSIRARYDVTTTTSPLLALEALTAGDEVDAIVCDVRMPELGGPDFYRSVRAKRSELGRRFVFVTGNPASAIDPFFARKELLIKPVPAVEILAALARVLAA